MSRAERDPPVAEVSLPIFEWPRRRERMGIGTDRGAVPGTAALLCGAGRQSPHECWVRLALGLRPGAASATDSKPGRGQAAFATAAVTRESTQQSVIVPGKGNYCLLTLRAL